jgi:nucleoside-diphosphate-sugar epimerase
MRVFITGGSGFIGSQLAVKLLESSAEVILFDLSPDESALGEASRQVRLIQGDLLDLPKMNEIMNELRPQVVVHLAAFRNNESQEKPHGAFLLNCLGTANILSAANDAGVSRVVYASTVAVYGAPDYYRKLGFNPFCLTEEAPPKPGNVYGVTKLCTEGMAQQYNDIYGMETLGLRLPIILGRGKKAGSKTSVFNDVIENPLMNRPAEIDSYGDQVLNLMYVKDAAHALAQACVAPAVSRSIYNAGGVLCRTRDLVEMVRNLLPLSQVTLRETDRERGVASGINSSMAERDLDYRPNFSLEMIMEDYQREIQISIAQNKELR